MTTENILEQIREGQAQEEALKKHFGGYRTKEVDQFVEKLLGRLHNMETVYQERCEEMRTHLRGVTRERDEQAQKAHELDKRLEDLPQLCASYLAGQGCVALPGKEYERLQGAEAACEKEAACLKERQEYLEGENRRLLNDMEQAQTSQRMDEETLDELERARAQAKDFSDECQRLEVELTQQAEAVYGLQTRLEESELLARAEAEELVQERARYRMLELQYQLAQNITKELAEEKERRERETLRWQERSEAERRSLVNRYRGILRSQQHCMERLHESFVASVRCMERRSCGGHSAATTAA